MRARHILATAAAGIFAIGLGHQTGHAADLGGDCCADLEERVAELEATTVRKGNSKISLKVSGWISQQIMWWDDGAVSDTYILDVGSTLASYTAFTGSAKINEDWSAGFNLHLEWFSSQSLAVDQNNDVAGQGGDPLLIYWWLKNERLGSLSVGTVSQASDNAGILPADVSGSNLIPANWVIFDGPAFLVRPKGGPAAVDTSGLAGATWGQFAFCHHIGAGIGADCNGVPEHAVKWESPSLAGLPISASWGSGNSFWDVAGRYSRTWGDLNFASAVAFSHRDEDLAGDDVDSDYLQLSAGVKHVPTGLFIYGAYGLEQNDTVFAADFTGRTTLPDGEHFYIKGGIQKKWLQLGATTIWGEYGEHDDQALAGFSDVAIGDSLEAALGAAFADSTITASTFTRWGFGIQQDIDAAAMSFYVKYRRHELDVDFANAAGAIVQDFEDFDTVIAGGIVNF
ncbi:MAG: porin [Methyloligellaceae bacterium]